jgi:ribosomal protein S18 acetylase RimI-like enzyme
VSATGDAERPLAASLVEVREIDPAHPDAQRCVRAYFTELDARFSTGFDPDAALPAEPDAMRPPVGVFLVAHLRSEPVGCGGLKFHEGWSELKRLWVSPETRGLGIGRRLLAELEARALEHGSRTIRLDTNGTLTEAIAMYRSAGYRDVPPFNDEPHADHWFERRLTR